MSRQRHQHLEGTVSCAIRFPDKAKVLVAAVAEGIHEQLQQHIAASLGISEQAVHLLNTKERVTDRVMSRHCMYTVSGCRIHVMLDGKIIGDYFQMQMTAITVPTVDEVEVIGAWLGPTAGPMILDPKMGSRHWRLEQLDAWIARLGEHLDSSYGRDVPTTSS